MKGRKVPKKAMNPTTMVAKPSMICIYINQESGLVLTEMTYEDPTPSFEIIFPVKVDDSKG